MAENSVGTRTFSVMLDICFYETLSLIKRASGEKISTIDIYRPKIK